jgi:hypothetical protein
LGPTLVWCFCQFSWCLFSWKLAFESNHRNHPLNYEAWVPVLLKLGTNLDAESWCQVNSARNQTERNKSAFDTCRHLYFNTIGLNRGWMWFQLVYTRDSDWTPLCYTSFSIMANCVCDCIQSEILCHSRRPKENLEIERNDVTTS